MKLSEQSMVGSGARSGLKSVVRATVIASCLISIAVLFRWRIIPAINPAADDHHSLTAQRRIGSDL